MEKNGHTGSDFDDFLEEEGILEEIEEVVAKRCIIQLISLSSHQTISKSCGEQR